VEIRLASREIAHQLRIDEGARVICRRQKGWKGEEPWALQASFYPMKLVEKGADRLTQAADMPEGTIRYLEDVLGIKRVRSNEEAVVRNLSMDEAAFFHLPTDRRIPVQEVRRTEFDERGDPILVTVTVRRTSILT
jgi:GntR family transcriptional regulator